MSEFVRGHIQLCINAAAAECEGLHKLAARLRAQNRLRLMVMDDDEIRELAVRLTPPGQDVDPRHEQLLDSIKEWEQTAGEWLKDLARDPADSLPRN